MGKLLATVVGAFILLVLASPREASACQSCQFGGYVCGIDQCNQVWVCQETHIGGGGYNDCYTDDFGCVLDGGRCQWASMDVRKATDDERFFASLSHAKSS
jgi:hypothetical protein